MHKTEIKRSLSLRFARACSCALFMCMTFAGCNSRDCERTWTSGYSKSPDQLWMAEVRQIVCDTGIGGALDVTVVLRRADEGQEAVVAIPAGQWADPSSVRALWSAPHKLIIAVPNRTLFNMQLPRYQGVDVIVKYDNDDPVDRARWAAWVKANRERVEHPGPYQGSTELPSPPRH